MVMLAFDNSIDAGKECVPELAEEGEHGYNE